MHSGYGLRSFRKKNDILSLEQIAADTGALLCLEVCREVEKITDFIRGVILECEQGTSLKIDGHVNSPYTKLIPCIYA